jgi:hypothetical protein
MAMTAADQFTYQLYEGNVASYSAEFFKLLDERNVFLKELEPITMGQFSGHPRFSSGALEQAAESKNGRYYSDPVISKMDTVCVLIHKKIIPAIYPPFEEIKERVKQDYLQKQTREFLFHKVESVRMQLIIPNQTIGEQFITLAKENNGVVTEFKSIEIKPDDRDPIHEIVRSLPLRQISAVITKNEKEKELLLVLAKEIPPTANEEKVLIRKKELEELNKSLFRDYLSELILHELGIKSNQDPIAQQMKIVAPLYYMQIENTIRR